MERQSYPDWSNQNNIKAALRVGLILLPDEYDNPHVETNKVYSEIFGQVKNFKKNQPG